VLDYRIRQPGREVQPGDPRTRLFHSARKSKLHPQRPQSNTWLETKIHLRGHPFNVQKQGIEHFEWCANGKPESVYDVDMFGCSPEFVF